MNLVLQSFFYDKRKVGTFGAIAIVVAAFVFMLLEGLLKHVLCLVYLHPNLWEISNFEGRSVFINKGLDINIVKHQIPIIIQFITFLRKVESLIHQRGVRIVHLRTWFNA
jgi:hypothetical protein